MIHTTISSSLKGLPLRCDCHLEWLYNFITSPSTPVTEAECNGGVVLSALNNTDAFTQCSGVYKTPHSKTYCMLCTHAHTHTRTHTHRAHTDVCTLGYHPCNDNATCDILPGSPNYQPTCSCKPGFEGDGIDCQIPPCECPLDHMVCVGVPQLCECDQGFTLALSGTSCDRTGNPMTQLFLHLHHFLPRCLCFNSVRGSFEIDRRG